MAHSSPGQTEADFRSAVARLAATDDALAAVIHEHGHPPFWHRPPGFRTLVLFILEQQVSLASAAAAYRRVEERTGGVTPEAVLASTDEQLRADGFSRQKTEYVRLLSEAVVTGRFQLATLEDMSDADARARLVTLKGIGSWTADVYLLSCLRRPDLWPVGDRALQVAVAETLSLAEIPDQRELQSIGERWKPDRSAAARILWHGYLARRGRSDPETASPTVEYGA